ncbi:hypothetical protein [Caudoviricetes sp.]|nr:hypothetical protein [Caudoviricetes sp.]
MPDVFGPLHGLAIFHQRGRVSPAPNKAVTGGPCGLCI